MNGRYFLQLILLSALWGASFLFIRIASPLLGPNVLAGVRIALATLTLAVIMRLMRQRWPWRHWRKLVLIGALSVALPFLLYSWAALQLPAGYAALLNSTAVVFATLSAAWLKEERLTARKLVGCLFGFAGVALIVRLGPIAPTPRVLLAAATGVLASASYGISTPLMKRATTHVPPLAIAAGIHAAAALMLLPGAAWSWPAARFTPAAIAALLVMGTVTSGLAYWMHLNIMRHVSAVAAISPAFMIPVFGVAWGHLFLGEPLGSGLYAGGALVLLATALVTGFNPFAKWMRERPTGS
ncbi:permease [Rhodoferax koreense]|uniref:Permease n=1 Tax=Rhodoferax koreensis TaxID=1842727 RepID=A0A1P8JUH9_9BURK|nr:DMT family transporter [Rhodoferax koreense]APW37403.1 permease [Rhodoferax koreense]